MLRQWEKGWLSMMAVVVEDDDAHNFPETEIEIMRPPPPLKCPRTILGAMNNVMDWGSSAVCLLGILTPMLSPIGRSVTSLALTPRTALSPNPD